MQHWPNSGTCASQHFLFFDNRRKIKSRKPRFVSRPPLSRLPRRFAPLRGTQRRCAALFFAPPGRYAPCALRAQPFWKHEKNAVFFSPLPCRSRGEILVVWSRNGTPGVELRPAADSRSAFEPTTRAACHGAAPFASNKSLPCVHAMSVPAFDRGWWPGRRVQGAGHAFGLCSMTYRGAGAQGDSHGAASVRGCMHLTNWGSQLEPSKLRMHCMPSAP